MSQSNGDEVSPDDYDDGTRRPGPPAEVQLSDFGSSEATLRWAPPGDDGGLAITGYFVHSRKTGEKEWEEFPQRFKPTARPTAVVNGLDDGSKYEFRVSFFPLLK